MVEQAAKKAVRAQLRQVLKNLPAMELHRRSVAATDRLVAEPEFQASGGIMLFLPLPYEVDAQPIAIRAWQAGKTVTVPYVQQRQRHMIPLEINNLGEPMHTDRMGLRTPARHRPIPLEMIDLVVVPGLGFDLAGRRLGRGGGFYDRFLGRPEFQGVACGLALEEQLVDRVPAAAHDVNVSMLATDQRLIRFNTQRSESPGTGDEPGDSRTRPNRRKADPQAGASTDATPCPDGADDSMESTDGA